MPNFLDKTLAAIAPTFALERAVAKEKLKLFGYDAANPGTLRGGSGGSAKNASSENAQMARDRIRLMWDARDLERQMPVLRCVLDRCSQYVCSKIRYQARTGDKATDIAYELYFEKWANELADITGRYDFRTLVWLAFRAMLRDGDFGFAIVRTELGLQLQSIEADRIGDPHKASNASDELYVSGITLDENGRPVTYDVFNRSRIGQYTFDQAVPAESFVHLTNPTRVDEYRTVTWLCAVLGQARDLYEAFTFERGAAKWAASIAGVIRSPSPMGGGNGGLWDGTTTTDGKTSTMEAQANKLLSLRPGQDVTPFPAPNRPSGAFQALIELTLQDIARGINVPYGFFDMSRLGGATSRLEAQQLHRTFQRFQDMLVHSVLERIKNLVIAEGIASGELQAVENWQASAWRFGAHITADIGNSTAADIQLMRAGLKSGAQIADEQGEDFDELVTALDKEAVTFRDTASQSGIPIEMVAPDRYATPTQMLADAAAATQPPEPPSISTMGDKAVAEVLQVQISASTGQLPREQAVATLVMMFGIDPAVAESLIPEKQAQPALAAPGGFGKPGAPKKDTPPKETTPSDDAQDD